MSAASILAGLVRGLRDGGRMMVGVPSYDTYLLHVRTEHPDAAPMTEAEFIRDRQAARFGEGGRGGFRCC